jgi:hypothetical protein
VILDFAVQAGNCAYATSIRAQIQPSGVWTGQYRDIPADYFYKGGNGILNCVLFSEQRVPVLCPFF